MFNPDPNEGVIEEPLNRHVFEELYLQNETLKVYDYKIVFDAPLKELSYGMQVHTI